MAGKSNTTLMIPPDWLDRLEKKAGGLGGTKALRKALTEATKAGLHPQPMPEGGEKTRLYMALSPATKAMLKKYRAATKWKGSEASLILAAANAWLKADKTTDIEKPSVDWLFAAQETAGYAKRRPQMELVQEITRFLSEAAPPVLLAEASTGVGKTNALLLSAAEIKKTHKAARTVIAVPTLAILRQYSAERNKKLGRLAQELGITVGFAYSKREYISKEGLQTYLEDIEDEKLKQALARFAEVTADWRRTALEDWIKRRRTLESGAALDYGEITLTSASTQDDSGMIQYERDRERWGSCDVLICTHAMLSLDLRNRVKEIYQSSGAKGRLTYSTYEYARKSARNAGFRIKPFGVWKNDELFEDYGDAIKECFAATGILPPYEYLMVDEAHALPHYMGLALTQDYSLISLRRLTRKVKQRGGIGKTAYSELDKCWKEIMAHGPGKGGGYKEYTIDRYTINDGSVPENILEWIRKTGSVFARLSQELNKRGVKDYNTRLLVLRLREIKNQLENTLSGQQKTVLHYSPVRGYPRLSAGQINTEELCDMLWRTKKKTVYVSGTLASGKRGETNDYLYSIKALSLSSKEVKTIKPIETDWLRKGVIVHLPRKQDSSEELVPGKDENDKFYQAQAKRITKIRKEAIGGTLVLCTSHEAVSKISEQIKGRYIVCSAPDQPVTKQIIKYRELYEEGKRPVWLMTGHWMGLDLTDTETPARDDHLIQNIVIQRLPFSPPKQRGKYVSQSFGYALSEAIVRFKQGIGRLVRRPGRKNMHIWILDGRIVKEEPHFNKFMGVLRGYKEIVHDL